MLVKHYNTLRKNPKADKIKFTIAADLAKVSSTGQLNIGISLVHRKDTRKFIRRYGYDKAILRAAETPTIVIESTMLNILQNESKSLKHYIFMIMDYIANELINNYQYRSKIAQRLNELGGT